MAFTFIPKSPTGWDRNIFYCYFERKMMCLSESVFLFFYHCFYFLLQPLQKGLPILSVKAPNWNLSGTEGVSLGFHPRYSLKKKKNFIKEQKKIKICQGLNDNVVHQRGLYYVPTKLLPCHLCPHRFVK